MDFNYFEVGYYAQIQIFIIIVMVQSKYLKLDPKFNLVLSLTLMEVD